jgi:hypothetical protein
MRPRLRDELRQPFRDAGGKRDDPVGPRVGGHDGPRQPGARPPREMAERLLQIVLDGRDEDRTRMRNRFQRRRSGGCRVVKETDDELWSFCRDQISQRRNGGLHPQRRGGHTGPTAAARDDVGRQSRFVRAAGPRHGKEGLKLRPVEMGQQSQEMHLRAAAAQLGDEAENLDPLRYRLVTAPHPVGRRGARMDGGFKQHATGGGCEG